MRTCKDCKYADWKRTKTGALHPSGEGRCRYPWKMPPLPASMFWSGVEPTVSGGMIFRNREFVDHCPYYVRGG